VRSPSLHAIFGLPNALGLTDLLQEPDMHLVDRALLPTSVENLYVLPSGTPSANPWELFRSSRLQEVCRQLRDQADYILFDTPSALAFTEALNLAPLMDAAFLCVRALEPPSGGEQHLIELLKEANVVMLGSVLNDMPASYLDSYHNYVRYYPSIVR